MKEINEKNINVEDIYNKLISENAITTQVENYTLEAYCESSCDCLYINIKHQVNKNIDDLEWLKNQINSANLLSMSTKIFLIKNEIFVNISIILGNKITQDLILSLIEKAIAFSKSIDQYLDYEWSIKNN